MVRRAVRREHFDRTGVALGRVLGLPVLEPEVAELDERIRDVRAVVAARGEPHDQRARRELQRRLPVTRSTGKVGAPCVTQRPRARRLADVGWRRRAAHEPEQNRDNRGGLHSIAESATARRVR